MQFSPPSLSAPYILHSIRGAHKGEASGLQPQKWNLKNTDFVDTISKVLRDLPLTPN